MGHLIFPFFLQGLAMFVDEFYFHEKRGLPRWERIGHPLDSFVTLLPYIGLFGGVGVKVYVGLSVFSCLFITKDEYVHTERCGATEHWLHAMLFVLHPLTLACAWFLWERGEKEIVTLQALVIFLFMSYQIMRWSTSWIVRAK